MNLKKFAVRGLVVLAIFVALCMFFSGTIKTITTAKVKITQGKTGRLEEKTELTGKLVFPETEAIGFDLGEGQTLKITKVNFRPGYTVKEGDVVVEAGVADYDATMKQYQTSYDEALDALLQLESKNGSIRLRKSDEIYADAYFALRDAKKETVAAKIAMETLLNREKLTLPDEGAPEGASEALVAAIEDYRAKVQAEQTATEQMNAAERYMPDDAVWTYISSKRGYQDAMADAERKMQALGELSGSVQAITAPRDGYIAEVLVKEGDTYDGSGALFSVNKEGSSPVLRADLTGVEKNVAEGMTVTVSSDRYGSLETKVLSVGMDAEGKKYADVELTDDIIQSMGSVYSMTVEDTPLVLVNRAKQQTTLLSASAVHGSGTDRYIYTVDTTYSNFGNSKMTVHKMSVTVLAEAGGVASIQEDVGYYSIAYMEDRPINDGDTVMLYDD